MNQTNYGFSKMVNLGFEEAVQRTKEALKTQGFGVLTTIDVKAAMKEKIDEDMEEYIILGACNPKAAFKVLGEEIEMGLLLPCNVIVYNKDAKTHVAVIRPITAMSIVENVALEATAQEIEGKLKLVLDSIS